jgi:hypothetical protein
MILIAHRGLVLGPSKEFENKPAQIETALAMGFDAEIDLRVVDGELWLGHDEPQYKIDQEFLQQNGLWIHAKNLEALDYLVTTNLNYFWHQEDDYTLTSSRYIWAYPGKPTTGRSIVLMPEWSDMTFESLKEANFSGICSDYVHEIRKLF